jgi:CheY-like chemotaxis protein
MLAFALAPSRLARASVAAGPPHPLPQSTARPRLHRRWSVLIVEDDPLLRSQLAELFRLEGFGVEVAPEGLAALQLLQAGAEPDVILLDMHLDGVDGWEFSAELHQVHRSPPPVLVITGDPDPRRCAQQVGAWGYLAKPFALGTLLHAVEHLLDARSA